MATLEGVIRTVVPGAIALGPTLDHAASTVAWVRVMRARVPAFDALETGDLVIVPEGTLGATVHEPADGGEIADELARAGVAGVVLVTQARGSEAAIRGGPAGPLVGRLVTARVPVFHVSGQDESTLERAVIGYLVNERAELDRQVGRLEADLQSIQLQGGGFPEMAAAIAGFLGRAVAIEDQAGNVAAIHAATGSPAGAVAAARYQANRRDPVVLRRGLPGGGAFVVLGEGSPSELETRVAERLEMLLALEFSRDVSSRRERGRGGGAMPAGGPPWVSIMARQNLEGEDVPLARREEIRERVRRLAPARRLLLRGDAASIELRAVATAGDDDPLGTELAGRIAAQLDRPIAVSRPFREAAERPAADAEARALLDAADELAAIQRPPAVLRGDRLAMYRLLGSLHNLPDGERHARALLAPVLRGSLAAQGRDLATLRAALGSVGPAGAAAVLGVHRNTIAYRLRALERRSGWDLQDPELRFALAVALRFVQK